VVLYPPIQWLQNPKTNENHEHNRDIRDPEQLRISKILVVVMVFIDFHDSKEWVLCTDFP
jgi:hypothetical protein